MEMPEIIRTLFGDKPYFGGNAFGLQSSPVRHLMMLSALSLIAKRDQPLRVLEVGSWVGSSALTFAEGVAAFAPRGGTVHCVDIWTSYASETDRAKGGIYHFMDTLTKDDLAYQLFLHNIGSYKGTTKITHERGRSVDILPTLPENSFDLVYIDGSHYRDDVTSDLKNAARLVRNGGLLTGDDLEAQVGEVDLDFALAHVEEDYCKDPATETDYHPGVTLAVHDFFGRQISVHNGFWTTRKVGDDFEDFDVVGGECFVPDYFPVVPRMECQQLIQQMARGSGANA